MKNVCLENHQRSPFVYRNNQLLFGQFVYYDLIDLLRLTVASADFSISWRHGFWMILHPTIPTFSATEFHMSR